MTAPEIPEVEIRPAVDILGEVRRGALVTELSTELHTLIDRVVMHDKPGELALKVKVKPVGDMQIEITGDIAVKLPKPAPPTSIFFVDNHGNATRHDPAQQRMFQVEDD